MATTLHTGVIPGAEAKKLYSYPTLSNSATQLLTGKGTWVNTSAVTVGTATNLSMNIHVDGFKLDGTKDVVHYAVCKTAATSAVKQVEFTGGFDETKGAFLFMMLEKANTATEALQLQINNGTAVPIVDIVGETIPATSFVEGLYLLLYSDYKYAKWLVVKGPRRYEPVANSTISGAMSAADKVKLDQLTVHPTMATLAGQPTGNQTPAFGDTFNIGQVTRDSLGHVSAINTKTVKIPNAVASTLAAGLMSKEAYVSLTSALTRIASIESILTTAATVSVNSTGGLVYKLKNGTALITIDKAGEY